MMKENDDEETLFDQETLLNAGAVKFDGQSFWCRKFTKTIVLSVAFFALGLCIAIPGPTLLELSYRVNTDVEHISLIFTARSVGYLLGSIIGGFLFDHFDQQILLFYSLVLTAIATIVAPWCTSLVVLAIMISFQGLTMGVLDTGGNVFCIKIWGRKSGPYMQVVHFAFGIGAFVAPLLARPFLLSQEHGLLNQTHGVSGVQVLGRIPHTPSLVWNEQDNPHYRYLRDVDLNNSFTDSLEDITLSSTSMYNTSINSSAVSSSFVSSTTVATKPKKPKHSDTSNFSGKNADGHNLKNVHDIEVAAQNENSKTTTQVPTTSPNLDEIEEAGANYTNTSEANNHTAVDNTAVNTSVAESISSTTTPSATTPPTTPPTTTPPTTTPTTIPSTTTTTSTTTTPTTTQSTTTPLKTTTPPSIITSETATTSKTTTPPETSVVTLAENSVPSSSESSNISTGVNISTVSPVTTTVNRKPQFVDLVNGALDSLSNMSKIQFAYLIIGLLLLINSVMFLVLYCKDRNRTSVFSRDDEHDSMYGKETSGYRITMLVILFFFFFVYVGMEVTFGGLLSTYAVEENSWSHPKSAVLTSIFWGSLAAGRGCAIFVARCFKPPCMLITDLVLVVIGSIILCFGVGKLPYVLWGGTLVIGFGMSSIFPTGVSWADEYFPLTGKSTAVFVVGSALGEMVIPVLTGYLYEKHHKTFLYVMFATSVLLAVIYVVMQCFASSRPKILSSARNGFVRLQDDDNIAMEDMDQNFEGSGLLETSRHRGPRKHPKPANMELEYSRLVEIDD